MIAGIRNHVIEAIRRGPVCLWSSVSKHAGISMFYFEEKAQY